MEGFQKSEGKKVSSMEIGALVVALMGAVDATPARALEIDPSTSWGNGIEQNVRHSALNEKVEYGATYVLFADGSGTWLRTSSGKSREVTLNVTELQKQAHSQGKSVSNICMLHTHPVEAYRVQQDRIPIPAERVPSAPSEQDIKAANIMLSIPGGPNTTFAAADGQGIWYYSAIQKSGLGKISHSVDEDSLKRFDAVFNNFVIKSVGKGFDLNTELPALQQAYRQYLHGEIRFVPYDQIKNEPPCAGVHSPTPSIKEKVISMDLSQPIKSFQPPQ